jgi:hypothetical protein
MFLLSWGMEDDKGMEDNVNFFSPGSYMFSCGYSTKQAARGFPCLQLHSVPHAFEPWFIHLCFELCALTAALFLCTWRRTILQYSTVHQSTSMFGRAFGSSTFFREGTAGNFLLYTFIVPKGESTRREIVRGFFYSAVGPRCYRSRWMRVAVGGVGLRKMISELVWGT